MKRTFKSALLFGVAALAMLIAVTVVAETTITQPTDEPQLDRWTKWKELGLLTNCSAASINTAVTCGGTRGFRTSGYNVLTLEIFYDYAAGTGYEFYLETCDEGHATTDCTADTDWNKVAVQFPAPSSITLTPGKVERFVAADDYLTWTIGINYQRVRLGSFIAKGSPTSSDKVTVTGRLGWSYAF